MRAALFGLLGVVLALGSAQAAECRAGRMVFVGEGKTFQVEDASRTRTRFEGRGAERVIFRGVMGGKPYIVDIQGAQGSSTYFTSYSGRTPERTAMKPNWGVEPSDWSDGVQISVYDGPLKGDWQAVCR